MWNCVRYSRQHCKVSSNWSSTLSQFCIDVNNNSITRVSGPGGKDGAGAIVVAIVIARGWLGSGIRA